MVVRSNGGAAVTHVSIATLESPGVEQRFAQRVTRADGCWLFNGGKTHFGYGRLSLRGNRWITAHRFAWLLHRGDIPDVSLCVLHRCDNPPCVNPDHLFLGTHADNVRDMVRKGRASTGAWMKFMATEQPAALRIIMARRRPRDQRGDLNVMKRPAARIRVAATLRARYQAGELRAAATKLTEDQVRAIFALRKTDSARNAAARFGVAQNVVQHIWRGRTWNRITGLPVRYRNHQLLAMATRGELVSAPEVSR